MYLATNHYYREEWGILCFWGHDICSLHRFLLTWDIAKSIELTRMRVDKTCKHIVIIWAPHQWKSSMTRQLCIDYPEFRHISMWNFFRRDIDNLEKINKFRDFCILQESLKWRYPHDYIKKTYPIAEEINKHFKESLESWKLIDYKFYRHYLVFVLNEVMAKIPKETRLVLDWFVRQRKAMTLIRKYMKEFWWVRFFHFSWKNPKLAKIRKINWKWEVFPHYMDFDPKTWERLIERPDDNPKILQTRNEVFENITWEAINHQQKKWAQVTNIDVGQDFYSAYGDFKEELWLENRFLVH